ncbi:MAG: hypothetical protein ACSNEK_05665 [Parachlamydiaceae bacterium]
MNINTFSSHPHLKMSEKLIHDLKDRTYSSEGLPNEITRLVLFCLQAPSHQDQLLCNLMKITRQISLLQEEGREIWERIDQEARNVMSILFPQNYFTTTPSRTKRYALGTFNDGSVYNLKFVQETCNSLCYALEEKPPRYLAFFPNTPIPVDEREALGIKILEIDEASKKGSWAILPGGNQPYEKLHIFLQKNKDRASLEQVSNNLLCILTLEKEFGIRLYHEKNGFQTLEGRLYPLSLQDCSLTFIKNCPERHQALINSLPTPLSQLLSKKYNPATRSFFENIKPFFQMNLLPTSMLNDQNAIPCRMVSALFSVSQREPLPWHLFNQENFILLTYLLALKKPLSDQPLEIYDLAKSLIRAIPKRGSNCDLEEFTERHETICSELRGKLFTLLLNQSAETGQLDLGFITDCLSRIADRLTKESKHDETLRLVTLDPDKEGFYDPCSSTGDYFQSIFSEQLLNDLRSLASKQLTEEPQKKWIDTETNQELIDTKRLDKELVDIGQDPKGKLILLRLYNDLIAPVSEEKIKEILKPLYKQVKHDKLVQKLKRRLEMFKPKQLQ